MKTTRCAVIMSLVLVAIVSIEGCFPLAAVCVAIAGGLTYGKASHLD